MTTIANFVANVRIIALTIASLSLVPSIRAADVCLGPTATGNGSGSNWNNQAAWGSITFQRGNTYYIADGSYGSRLIQPMPIQVFTPRMAIKKAIASDHGPATGWISTLGDGQAVFQGPITIGSWGLDIDGQTGGGPGSWKSGFGFKINAFPGQIHGLEFYTHGSTASHIEVQGNYGDGDQLGLHNDLIVISGWSESNPNTFRYAYVHGAGSCLIFADSCRFFKFEYCYFGFMEDTAGEHCEIMSAQSNSQKLPGPDNCGPIDFYYCIFTSAGSTGGLMIDGPMTVYGCVFAPLDGNTLKGGHGVVGTWTQHDVQLKVYNCTFINLTSHVASHLNSAGDTCDFRNNIIMNSAIVNADHGPTHEYNHYINVPDAPAVETGKTTGTSDPFVDWKNGDFRLQAATTSGVNLSAVFNKDPLNLLRGADGVWDRGAYEFTVGQVSQPPPPTANPPQPPTGLRVLSN